MPIAPYGAAGAHNRCGEIPVQPKNTIMTSAPATFQLAFHQHQAGNLPRAEQLYRQIIAADPGHADSHHLLGVIACQEGRFDEAVASIRTAIALNPGSAAYHANLGNVLLQQNKLGEAKDSFQNALKLKPDSANVQVNLGTALRHQGNLAEASDCFRQAVQINPALAEAHYNLGNALRELGSPETAAESFQKAISLKADFAFAHLNLGEALLMQGQPDVARASFQEALRLQPDLAVAQSGLLCCISHDPTLDPDIVFAEHCRWGTLREALHQAMDWQSVPLHVDPERRLRIGYVSPDLRNHAVARYLEPVLANHDPQAVEVFCYAEVSNPDSVTARLQKLVQSWRWTCNLTDAQVAEQIRSDQIDILVDLAGNTRDNRLGVFALKPAPVQATWLGYLNTTGLKAIDYRLTDAMLDPPGQPLLDTEDLVPLPGGMCCFAPPEDAPSVARLPALNNGRVTFGSLHSLFKLNNQVIDLWSRVLKAVPAAKLLVFRDTLTDTAKARLRREFAQRGIGGEQLDLRHGSTAHGYLGVYDEIDISLDTTPWSGGVTTCESLWMGVPVLTLIGVRPIGRNSAALLTRVGLTDWIADKPEKYVAMAMKWACDLDQLAKVRAGLRERTAEALCDASGFTKQLEAAFRGMWRGFCARHQTKK